MSMNQSTVACKKIISDELQTNSLSSASITTNSSTISTLNVTDITTVNMTSSGNISANVISGNSITANIITALYNFIVSTIEVISTTASTSSTTGAFLLSGGIGINNTTDATSSTNGGTITTAGGVAIAKKLFVGDSISSLTSLSGQSITGCIETTGETDSYSLIDFHSKNSDYDARIMCTSGSAATAGEGILSITAIRTMHNNPMLLVTAGANENIPNITIVYPSNTFWSGPRTGRGNVTTTTTTDVTKTITYSSASRMDLNHNGLYYYSIRTIGEPPPIFSVSVKRWITVQQGSAGDINTDISYSTSCSCSGLIYVTNAPDYITFYVYQETTADNALQNDAKCRFMVTFLS